MANNYLGGQMLDDFIEKRNNVKNYILRNSKIYEVDRKFYISYRSILGVEKEKSVIMAGLHRSEPKDFVENFPLDSIKFKRLVSLLMWEFGRVTPSKNDIDSIINGIIGESEEIMKLEGSRRIHFDSTTSMITYQMSEYSNFVLRVTPETYYFDFDDTLFFREAKGMLPQIVPTTTTIEEWHSLVNDWLSMLDEDQLLVFKCYLVSIFFDASVIAYFVAPQGSGKTTLSIQAKSLVDPSQNGASFVASTKESNLINLCSNNFLVVLNNVQSLPMEFQRVLTSTYDKNVKANARKLYSDNDTFLIDLKSCVILNSVEFLYDNYDLLDRSLVFSLPPRNDFAPQNDVDSHFESIKPKLLGGILEILTKVLAILEKEKGQIFCFQDRLAEFQRYAEVTAVALGLTKDDFHKSFTKIRKDGLKLFCDSKPDIEVIDSIFANQKRGIMIDTAQRLLDKLRVYVSLEELTVDTSEMSKDGSKFSKLLNKNAFVLEKYGITVTRKVGAIKYIIISKGLNKTEIEKAFRKFILDTKSKEYEPLTELDGKCVRNKEDLLANNYLDDEYLSELPEKPLERFEFTSSEKTIPVSALFNDDEREGGELT